MKTTDNLILKRKVGGSIIERRPIFTSDGKYLCVVEKECVRSYSARSGDCVLEFYPPDEVNCDIVGIGVHENYLYAVSSKGILMIWSFESQEHVRLLKLKLPHTNFTVFDLIILDHGYKENKNSLVELSLLMSNDNDELHNNRVTICSFNADSLQEICRFTVCANNDVRSVAFCGCYDKVFVGSILTNELRIYPYRSPSYIHRIKCRGGHLWTVIRSHPTENCFAIGDSYGGITLFYNVASENLQRAFYQWHILPVMDIIFSPNGTQMFTGGSECVLVKWDVYSPDIRHYMPRLAAPIAHFSMSPNNSQIALALQNNSILLVDPQLHIECSIQQFTWGLIPIPGQPLFPAGICCDPSTETLILNGRPGHIQFFSLKTNSLLCNLDITEMNYLTQEPGTYIYNLEVTHVAFSRDGKWLATVETRNDEETSLEIRMKIWFYNSTDQGFKLNTYCDAPHQDLINAVKFQPMYSLDNEKRSEDCLVTTGNDKKFRVWSSGYAQNENKKNAIWKCERMGFYKDYPAGPAGFSSDGSVLAVGFGPCLTIWDIDNHGLVASLTCNRETLTFVEIEQTNYSHLAVCTSSSELRVWNLLTLTVLWTVPLNVSVLVSDPLSEYMAAFTQNNSLYVFKPSNPQPVYENNKVCPDGKALAAVFVPKDNTSKTITGVPNWMQHSQLHFVTSTQELMCVEMGDENEYKSNLKEFDMFSADSMTKTPFAVLIAKQSKIMEEDHGSVFKTHPPVGLVGEAAIRKLLSAPIHTMPQINLFCNEFLKSFITKSGDKKIIATNEMAFKNPEKKKKKKKKKKNKLIKKIVQEQKEEFDKLFTDINRDIDSMDVDNSYINDSDDNSVLQNRVSDSAGQFDLNDDVNSSNDDEDDDENDSVVKNVPLNRMFSCMKNDKKINKKKKLRKRTRTKSKSDFVVDDTPDLGLLNLFKNN